LPDIDISLYPNTLAAFGGNEQRAKVFLDRYSRKDSEGLPFETLPNDMWDRVSIAIGEDGEQRDRFRDLLEAFKFVPGGRILAGAGIDAQVTYYNCYVIPVETKARRIGRGTVLGAEGDRGSDSREAIFDTIGLMVDIMSRGGGVGINWSVLRPKGAYLKTINGTTSGPVSWMDVASRAVGVVEQGGSRRGAAMFMLDDWHPDVLEFIDAKRDFSLITNANVSVAVSDDFMRLVEQDGEWDFVFPDTGHPAYNTDWDGDLEGWIEKHGIGSLKTYGTVRAREMWRKMAEAAWASGEPGIVFLDRYNKLSTAQGVERIISVNPCGEQGLGPYSVCNLGAMNLAAYIEPARRSGKPSFAWEKFTADVATAVEFLDRVIDVNYYFIPENEAVQKKLRRIGLGVMGLADALIALGLRYGDDKAVEFTERVFKTMKMAAVSRSAYLAEQKGAAPGWEPRMAGMPYLAEYRDSALGRQIAKHGLRNLFLLTQAPTGTTSILAGVNSGIEPYFALGYWRKDRTGEHFVQPEAIAKLTLGENKPDFLVTSGEVSVEEHIAMQAAAQRHIDSSVSKTINGPNQHTVEDVEKAYTLAHKVGLKGVAYFRDGSGRNQVLYKDEPKRESFQHIDWCQSTGAFGAPDCDCPETEREEILLRKYEELQAQVAELAPHAVVYTRPAALFGTTVKVRTSAGTAYVTVNVDENGRPVELFVNVGKAGSDIMELGEAIGRMASLSLQSGASLTAVANQLVGIGGNGKFNPPLAHAIGVALLEVNLDNAERRGGGYHDCEDKLRAEGRWPVEDDIDDPDITALEAVLPAVPKSQRPSGQMCPECNNFTVALEEGCKKCMSCGWSAC
jgi:ribonucleoside-diphosphate reductase alpha chain